MSDSTNPVDQITVGQAQPAVPANQNFDAASPAMLYGRRASTCSGLTWGYYGGRFESASIAAGTQLLGASTTTYMVASRSTGAVSFSTATTNWDNQLGYMRLYKIVTGGASVTSYEDHRQAVGLNATGQRVLQIACSDESTALTTGTAKVRFRAPYAMTLLSVRASLSAPQAGGSIFTVDVNKNGTTVLSTKLTIDNGESTSTTAATPPVISVTSIADDDEMSVDIDQVGDGSAAGLKVTLIGQTP